MKHILPSLFLFLLATPAMAGEVVAYTHDGTTLEGYVATPKAGEGPYPTVLVAHQWKGLGEYEKQRADMLADLGYVAFAVDVYGQGVRPETVELAAKESTIYKDDPVLARGRMNAALEYARSLPQVDKDKIAAMGYCFGGTMVLELARSGADIDGVVSFHGGLATKAAAGKGDIKSSVFVHHGAVDPYVKDDEVATFKEEMKTSNADWQFISYADAVHAFTEKASGDDASTGVAYNEKADKRSWAYTLEFFKELFGE